ncbi:7-deoxyloganetic acid glucosyltransferase [Manihot esculenta]|uniref:Glycosyltransferase n=2 Tax=Manihot esculenta TaxID=3983 RepID=A0A2C9VN86_MANES|nr:7-deoxyloganetic acid glucosyltransferase [Manihot esculenta]KAG8651408.1 hypothetical protein MANES_07G123400v8 [Manihot esculenta]OAY46180.1 hypothetical protein MANES_07G123400v8 [Manihot esculenta]
MEQGPIPSPHVLIFPAPGQGHVNAILKLAELLSLSGFKITFLNFHHIHERLLLHTDIEARFSKYHGFQFKTIPSFRLEQPRPADAVRKLLEEVEVKSRPIFKRMVIESNPAVNYIIGDGLMGFVYDVALELGIPAIQMHCISACSFWTVFSIPDVVAAHQLPIKGKEDMDRLITRVPGMESFLRCRDLPAGFCQVSDLSDPNLFILTNQIRQSQALIINSFEELEGPILSQIRTRYPKIYTIGPVHEHLKKKLRSIGKQESYSSSTDLFKVDKTCITWLDNQPPQSVLYVSFGSVTIMTREQLMEFWYGLVNSKKKFLWVIRPESVNNLGEILQELQEGEKKRGYIIKWAPQEEVLAHKAIGGFLTHSGWNSTLESIVAGVPMICWPYFGDQQVNSRFVSEVWNLGLDMKDVCDRRVVEKMVNDLMVDRREEFVRSTAKMAELARKSVSEGGSSSCCLNSLIDDMRVMIKKACIVED